jgi:ferric-dicitrate binding protein FerR (iron transport regulator)
MMNDYYSTRDDIWQKIVKRAPELESPRANKRVVQRLLLIAASLVLALAGIYLVVNLKGKKASLPVVADRPVKDIPPGSDRANLRLDNGSVIDLENRGKGLIAVQGDAQLIKTDSGSLSYASTAHKGGDAKEVGFNTLTTPRAGQFHLVLPDGTGVWLNAQSSITYPVAFAGKERRVEMQGEAYFEVVRNQAMPFIIGINHQAAVEVLGTKFNVMAYSDEPVLKTSLIEGSVKMTKGKNTVIIKPGEEAESEPGAEGLSVVKASDIQKSIAWKNGRISFTDADVKTIMRMLARWYDIEVIYQGPVPVRKLVGGIDRNTNLSDVLNVLKYYGIQSRLEGRQLTIYQ